MIKTKIKAWLLNGINVVYVSIVTKTVSVFMGKEAGEDLRRLFWEAIEDARKRSQHS